MGYAVGNSNNDRDLKCKMNIAGEDVIFQVDTGATCNLLPERLARNIKPYWGTLTMWNDSKYKPKGMCRTTVTNPKNGKKYKTRFIVCNDNCQPLLGLKASKVMGLLEVREDQFERIALMKAREPDSFHDVFDGKIGKYGGEVDPSTHGHRFENTCSCCIDCTEPV